jgi:DNA adenine methylase
MSRGSKILAATYQQPSVSLFQRMKERSSQSQIQISRPILKWAGGKTQLLDQLLPRIQPTYHRYVEPFFGGGALFFNLRPGSSVIADINPELINLYQAVADNVETVIGHLAQYRNQEKIFYQVRAQDWTRMSPTEAAARTIYLNRTCFNGLYRVNRRGQFNVPYGKYRNPKILDASALRSASTLLSKTKILCADYKTVLGQHVSSGDLVFLDPPYLPISKYADFRRYTKEQFTANDHIELADEVKRLHELGCHVILTNSNHPLVRELYKDFHIQIVQTKRYISCHGADRKGEDVIITPAVADATPNSRTTLEQAVLQQSKFPTTRYMGSKSKLLGQIWDATSRFDFDSVLDLFSGSGVVGYMFKARGKKVISNDYLAMSAVIATATIENDRTKLSHADAVALCKAKGRVDNFVRKTFKGLYFTDEENRFIDVVRSNIKRLRKPHKKALAMAALIRACFKKRPRGIFTYIGRRYDDGRRDLQKSIRQQFMEAVDVLNDAVFDNGKTNKAIHADAMSFTSNKPDLVYIDPPYYSPHSDNEYVRRYHFVEGLARDWKGVDIQEHTLTKKFKNYPTPFASRNGAKTAFDVIFDRFKDSILVVSYSSNSLPTMEEMIGLLKQYKTNVEVVQVDHRYSIGNQASRVGNNKNDVKEYIFLGY